MNDIKEKTNQLIDSIESNSLYKRYLLLKEEMLNDKKITSIISEVKTLQKKLIKNQSLGIDISSLDEEIKEKINLLNDIALYVEYDNTQKELNLLLQNIKSTIESCINDITK